MLVLLPGMDGTGDLFAPFLAEYQDPSLVVPLSQTGSQSHEDLIHSILDSLPREPFILLAESFSGSFVPLLLARTEIPIKAVIFSASFLSSPSWLLQFISPILPLESIIKGDRIKFFARQFLGDGIADQRVEEFIDTVRSVSPEILKARMKAIAQLKPPCDVYTTPALYMQGKRDRVVPPNALKSVRLCLPQLEVVSLDCAHGVLQACPKQSAELIREYVQRHLATEKENDTGVKT